MTDSESNRAIVLDFYDKALRQWDWPAASVHIGDTYLQHSPGVPDGIEGIRGFIENVPPEVRANLKSEIRRVLADGDLVAIHTYNRLGDLERVIVDIFRVANGKLVEHWDVVQDVPPNSLHDNPIA